jgi:hypothetical protein
VKIDDITDTLTVRIDTVNHRDAEAAVVTGYIAIEANRARTAAVGRRTAALGRWRAAQESWRKNLSDTSRFTSLGTAIGTTAGYNSAPVTPTFLVSTRLTVSPFSWSYFEIGSDFGLEHGEMGVKNVEYLSIAPYLHFNLFVGDISWGWLRGWYAGFGGGASFSQYTYPSESGIDPVTVNTPVADILVGKVWQVFPHSGFDLRYTVKTNFDHIDHRFTLGYVYRFGLFDD